MFIKLTVHTDEGSVWVCFDKVIAIEAEGSHTQIIYDTDKPAIGVKETPEQIMEMIENQNVYLQQFGRGERTPVPPEGPMLRYQYSIRK